MVVKGGPANSGKKRDKRTRRQEEWECECPQKHSAWIVRCWRCRMKRPEE